MTIATPAPLPAPPVAAGDVVYMEHPIWLTAPARWL